MSIFELRVDSVEFTCQPKLSVFGSIEGASSEEADDETGDAESSSRFGWRRFRPSPTRVTPPLKLLLFLTLLAAGSAIALAIWVSRKL
ncbi:MAG: hypothetical protein ABEJ71_01085 [Halodesulfurarchaeum sp.]